MEDIYEYLKHNSYPGRGMILGRTRGEPVIAYFIMGRSENSRNRIFRRKDDTVFTEAYDKTKLKDPSLIIYNAVRTYGDKIIVSNGNQTDTICEYLEKGLSFQDALKTREYEPDEPNYTPRISGIIHADGSYEIEILKKEEDECCREWYSYPGEEGVGHFISTYDHDGDPLPSFSGKPIRIAIEDDAEAFVRGLWESLNPENRISLYVRFKKTETIINRYGGTENE